MQDIHAIRPPVQVGIDSATFYILLGVFIAILFFILIFFLIRKWLKKRKNVSQKIELPTPVAPYKAAMNSLKRLSVSVNVDSRLFYFDLTMVLRKYMGDSFCTTAVEMTSQEFVKSLLHIDLEKQIKQKIIRFQKYCDPIKYAGVLPEVRQIEDDLKLVEKMIDQIENELLENKRVDNKTIVKEQKIKEIK